MKTFLLFILILPMILGASPQPENLVASTRHSIVELEYFTGPKKEDLYTCTGFSVSAGRGDILTAAHCIPTDPTTTLFVNGKPSKIIKVSNSLALIRIEPLQYPALTIRKNDAQLGESVLTFGYAWKQFSVFNRNIAALLGLDIGLDGPLAPGMSGGPVIDGSGKVIGINQATNGVVGQACGVEEIRKFLEER